MSVPNYEGNLNLLLNIPAQQFKTLCISYSTHFPVIGSVSSTIENSLMAVHLAKLQPSDLAYNSNMSVKTMKPC